MIESQVVQGLKNDQRLLSVLREDKDLVFE